MKIHKNQTGSSWASLSVSADVSSVSPLDTNRDPLAFWTRSMRRKIMKMNAIVLLVGTCLSQVNAHTYGQQITIKKQKIHLEQVIKELERQSGYVFLYDKQEVESIKNINVSIQNKPFKEALNQVLQHTNLNVDFFDNTIVLKRSEDKNTKQTSSTLKSIEVQQHTLGGRIVDENGKGIPSVSIKLKSNGRSISTKQDGSFTIPNAGKTEVLIVTCIGYFDQEITISGTDNKIVLKNSDHLMEEVVVSTGIVDRNLNTFTGAATRITKDELQRVSHKNVIQSLKVLEPSLMIFDNLNFGSDPNALPEMTLRGNSTFPQDGVSDLKGDYVNNPNQPLFILDGFEVGLTKVIDLDMNRIESITILKDASAKAIYGSKAANGVVVIETKKNTENKVLITYSGSLDAEVPDLSSYNLTNAAEKLEAERIYGLYEQTGDNIPSYATQLKLDQQYNQRLKAVLSGVNTDWMSLPLRNAIGQKHGVSVELGDRDLKLITDFSYNNVEGVMKGSKRDVISTNAMMSYRFKGFLFRNIISYTNGSSSDSPYGTFNDYAKMNPYWTPYDEFGNLKKNAETGLVPWIGTSSIEDLSFSNPLYNSTLNTKLTKQYTEFTNNLYAEATLATGVKMLLRGSFTNTKNEADEFYPANHLKFDSYINEDFFRKGSYKKNEGTQMRYSGDLNINYNKPIGEKHLLFINAGGTISQRSFEEVIYNTEGFPNDRMNDILFAKQYAKYQNRPSGTEGTTRDLGLLSIASYSYDNRLFADASVRASASSQFGTNQRWGTFWSTGVGWNIHNEKWLNEYQIFDRLKLRASIGSTGSQNFSSYQSIATYTYFMDKVYQEYLGAFLKGLANPDLKWQQKMDYNVGLDFSIFRKLSGRFDYYNSITENTLVDFSLPPSTGFSSVKENMGKIKNTGMELMLNYMLYSDPKNRSYFSITGSAIRNTNKIVSISDALKAFNQAQDKIAGDQFNNKPVTKYYDGASMNAIWAVHSLGIDPANGREIYLKKNGAKTYTYSAADQVIVGDKVPKVSGSFGINGEYKGFGLSAYFRFLYGGQLYNQTLVDRVENVDMSYNVDKRVLNSTWQKPGDIKPYKALGSVLTQQEDGTWIRQHVRTQVSDRFVMNQNELALSSLSLSYDFYRWNYLKTIGLDRLRCALYTNDVFTVSSVPIERGMIYPFARKFSFSLTATF
ncbi:SusC/RagA family TonB-linked outer membrane protein [Sphingobacterium faecale]|uniref:SusC/RagA family TonB-linked outer membrane protein n=1 Tax=Sphingobacterium faecale TaxID=2803775 RepID=A0ABS1QYN0_9SPHI|nr:SusC/RagA family TonB-linked outer membrane protein [Sphingobacterium faecale]MBL1407554.1 SusC/RagA family TonB-linked outer membrane protein [Sphingobacterium faecale]